MINMDPDPNKQNTVIDMGLQPVDILSKDSRPSSPLFDIPVELQVKILSSTTWKDVLHVRMTCKCLFDVTMVRSIWAHLVEDHILNTPSLPRLERPIATYTASQLERLLLVWKSTDAAFDGDQLKPVRERRFCAKKPIAYSHLVPGGRWLLLVDFGGAVTYYDLDADKISRKSLIPRLIHFDSRNDILVSIDYDLQSPILKFTLALYLQENYRKPRCLMFQIWSVSLSLDSSERGVGFVTTRLAKFPVHPRFHGVSALSHCGSDLAIDSFDESHTGWSRYIVCWIDANGDSDDYPLLDMGMCCNKEVLHLLPGHRLLVFRRDSICLFDYTEEANTYHMSDESGTEDSDTEDSDMDSDPDYYGEWSNVLWRHSFEWAFVQSVHRHYLTHTGATFTFTAGNVVHSISIDLDPLSAATPSMTKLAAINEVSVFSGPYLGHSLAVVCCPKDRGANLSYYPLEYCEGTPYHTKFLPFKFPTSYGSILLDEFTGRVVLPRFALTKQSLVADLALSRRAT